MNQNLTILGSAKILSVGCNLSECEIVNWPKTNVFWKWRIVISMPIISAGKEDAAWLFYYQKNCLICMGVQCPLETAHLHVKIWINKVTLHWQVCEQQPNKKLHPFQLSLFSAYLHIKRIIGSLLFSGKEGNTDLSNTYYVPDFRKMTIWRISKAASERAGKKHDRWPGLLWTGHNAKHFRCIINFILRMTTWGILHYCSLRKLRLCSIK